MPNFNPYAVTPGTAATVTVQQYRIATTVYDDANRLVADYTGADALTFPDCLSLMPQATRDAFLADVGETIAGILAGVTNP